MQKVESPWRKDSEWKARYSKLYSSRGISMSKEETPRRISFMSNESTPHQSLLITSRSNSTQSESSSPNYFSTIMSQRSEIYASDTSRFAQSDDLGGHETMLLNMVRAQSKDLEDEAQYKSLYLPRDDDVSDDHSSEACMHGLSMRFTERSVSRSCVSRISTKRDMDIPSILAFTTSITAPVALEIPAFQKTNGSQCEAIPRWSIRRSVCPACSQKWRDRSAISNIKYSGLKRNASSELPSVIAPARLRAAITMAYIPRPTLAVVDEDIPGYRSMRNTSATWQLTRARKFRTPKLQLPSPQASAPPSAAAPLVKKDLDIRVHKFLTDEK